jgi:hypothetical protein
MLQLRNGKGEVPLKLDIPNFPGLPCPRFSEGGRAKNDKFRLVCWFAPPVVPRMFMAGVRNVFRFFDLKRSLFGYMQQ